LCAANKTHPAKTDRKGIYKLTCSCSPSASYVGGTRVQIGTRVKQHKDGVAAYRNDPSAGDANPNVSGITKHASTCNNGTINWDEPVVLRNFQDKDNSKLQKNLFIRESLEIRKQNTGPGLNDDFSKYVKTAAWGPVFNKLRQ
jgi:hypothetical protein